MSERIQVIVVGDTNDGDYLTKIVEFDPEYFENSIEKSNLITVARAINDFKVKSKDVFIHNWLYGDEYILVRENYLLFDEAEFFNECFVESSEWPVHTIKDIKINTITKTDDLTDRNINHGPNVGPVYEKSVKDWINQE